MADTSIWVAHFRSGDAEMRMQLNHRNIAIHPLIVAELALGSLGNREKTLAMLERIPQVKVAQLREVRRMIELHALFSRGIGLTDAHLVASALITPSTQLRTRDKRLLLVAQMLGVDSDLS